MTDKTQSEELQAYWRIAERMRSRARFISLSKVLQEGKLEGLKRPSWESFEHLMRVQGGHGFPGLPAYVADFFKAYLQGRDIDRIIDPAAGCGQLIGPLLEAGIGRQGTAWERNEEAAATGLLMTVGLPFEWQHADFLKVGEIAPADLVVSCPLIGLPPGHLKITGSDGREHDVRDSESHLLVLKACLNLSERGECLVLLPRSFAFGKPKSVWTMLETLGFAVDSIVAMPDGLLAPWTRISLSLFVIRRGDAAQRFIGKLVSPDQIEVVAQNMRSRQDGRAPEHGRLVDAVEFNSWEMLEYVERLRHARPKGNLSEDSLEEVALGINLAKRKQEDAFIDQPNSMYIPLIGIQPAVTSSQDLRIKPHNYAQVVLDPDKAYADYVAGYFNSEYGYMIRENASSGMFIPKINKQTLSAATVLLPPMEQQASMVQTHNAIRSLIYELRDKEKALWSHPAKADEIEEFVEKLTSEQSLESFLELWIETLPFPLASILWRYRADIDLRYKTDHLLHFFEAAAEFITCILLSGFKTDDEFFEENRARWLDGGEGSGLARSTFGYWAIAGERIAKDLRRLFSGKEEDAVRALSAFRTTDRRLLEALSSKELFRVLKAAKDYRNLWVAHAGIQGKEKYQKLLTNLESLLTDIRGIISVAFDKWLLLRPGAGTFKSGVYDYEVRVLKGSRSIFVKETIKSLEPLDEDQMYLMHANSNRPIELLPFLRMRRSPQSTEDACYFYNRVDGKSIRWLSYHYEKEDEVVEENPDILKVLTALPESGEDNK